MKQVKYVCKYCNKAETYTKSQQIGLTVFHAIISMLCLFGTVLVIYVALTGLSSTTDMIANARYAKQTYSDFDEIQKLSYDITIDCDGDDPNCYIEKLYRNVSSIRYVPSSDIKPIQSPLFTYYNGGDCKNTAFMFTYMLKSLGIYSRLDCSLEKAHCVAVVPLKDYDYYFVADLTMPILSEMNGSVDAWDYMLWDKRNYRI